VDQTLRALPGGLQVTVQLRTRITGELAVGTLIDAVIAANASAKGSVAVAQITRARPYPPPRAVRRAVPTLRGRARVSPKSKCRAFAIALTPTSSSSAPRLGCRDARYRDDGVSDELGRRQKIKKMRESIRLSRLPGVATLFYKGSSLDVHPGFLTVWKTRDVR